MEQTVSAVSLRTRSRWRHIAGRSRRAKNRWTLRGPGRYLVASGGAAPGAGAL